MRQVLSFLYTWLFFVPAMVAATLFLGIVCLLTIPFLGPSRVGQLTAVPWSRLGLLLSGVQVDFADNGHIDPRQSYVIVSNHLSQFDIWVLYAYLGIDFRWVMKQELRRIPIVGVCCEALGHIFINRGNSEEAIATLNEAKSRLTGGTSVLFFPEGTRSRDGMLQPFKKGAFKMARDLQLPVLPITLTGTREILPAGSLRLRLGGSVQVTVHEPLPAIGSSEAELVELMRQSEAAIASPLDTGLAETVT